MKPNQQLTPKYWIFHSTESDDVFRQTAAKALYDCKLLAALRCPKEFSEFYESGSSKYRIDLFEIKLIAEGV